jgi:hypothetical protein
MSATDPSPAPNAPEPDGSAEHRSAARNPWLWATAGLVVIAIALAVWALTERSNADDAKADLAAQEQKTAAPTTTASQNQTTQQTQTQAETQTNSSDEKSVHVGALAAAGAAFVSAHKQLNEQDAQIQELEAEADKANAEAEQAATDADKAAHQAETAKTQADSASDAQKKAEAESDQAKAEAEQANAEKRQLRAKAEAAAACAKSMLEIVGDIPKAPSLDEGLQKAGDDISALVPKCKDSVASAGS